MSKNQTNFNDKGLLVNSQLFRIIFLAFSLLTVGMAPAAAALYTASYGTAQPQSSNCDDCVDGPVAFPGAAQNLNFFGNTYTGLYVGSNGFVTFGVGNSSYGGAALPIETAAPMIAGQFMDLDSFNDPGSNVYVNNSTPGQLIVTWENMGRCCGAYATRSTFQLVIRSDQFVIPPGEGQIGFYFGSINEPGPASAGFGDGLAASNPGEQSIYSGNPSLYSNHAPVWFTLGAGGVPVVPVTVPTLSEWAMITFAMLIVGFGVYQRRRRQF
jgi:hypothetical protein